MKYDFDVVVVGAGMAGIAAAVAAARGGAKTVILEKTCVPGGLATAGLINIYLPLCDGNGTQVTFGLNQEFIDRSLKYGPGEIPDGWREVRNAPEVDRLRCAFSPASMILALEEVLIESGVEIWYDTLVTKVEKDGRNIRFVTVENSDGSIVVCGKSFVDGSGCGRLAVLAGESVSGAKNFLSYWGLEYENRTQVGNRLSEEVNMLRSGNPDRTFFLPTAKDATDYMLETRAMIRKFYQDEYDSGNSDRFSRWPLKVPSMPQFRKIAAVKGHFELSDNMNNTSFSDSIGMVSDWRKSGPVWEVPFGTIVPLETDNLFIAGRCISSVGDAWEISRCIPCAVLTGEAAGNAAMLQSTGRGENLLEDVQKYMVANGNLLHLEDLK